MKLSFASDRILAVMAHPDDGEMLCAGTLARAKSEGVAVGICVMCNGDKGAGADASHSAQQLAEIRGAEAGAAASALGAELYCFGACDGELMDSAENRRALIEIYRRFRPTLVIAHAEEDYHPDHRAAGALAEAASWFCASRGHMTASAPLEAPPSLWLADTVNMSGFSPQFYVDVGDFVQMKEAMLRCHKSQLQRGRDGDFAPLAELMMHQCRTRGMQSGVNFAEAFRQHHAFKRARAW